MKSNIKNKLALLRERYDHRCRQLSIGSGLLAFGGMAMAADGDVDVTDVLTKIAAGVAAAMLVSAAFTAAYLGIKASKVPRRGG